METIILVAILLAICYLIRVLDKAVGVGRRLEEKAKNIDDQLGSISVRVGEIAGMILSENEEEKRSINEMGTEESGPLLGDINELEK